MSILPKKVKHIPKGMVIGSWTVLEYIGTKGKGRNGYWKCQCICGNVKEVCASLLRTGKSTQCQSCSSRINGRKSLDSQTKQHLYVVRCGSYFKIGSSDNPKRRIKDLTTSNPYPIIIEFICLNEGYKEPLLHGYFRQYHHWGEWYTIPTIDHIIKAKELV